MSYKVKIDQFEGPFDLLVYLIEHARMSIYDIRVSEITAQYLDYISEMKSQDVSVAEEFMVLAAELIELKSRMLLPGSSASEEGAEEEDPRKDLVARILEYKQYKEMAGFFAQQEDAVSHIYTKPQEDISAYTNEPDEYLRASENEFTAAFLAFISRKQRLEEMRRIYERVERQRISVESRMTQISTMLSGREKMMFSEMLSGDKSPYNMVITFMSLLELIKQRAVTAQQKKRFSDIEVKAVNE